MAIIYTFFFLLLSFIQLKAQNYQVGDNNTISDCMSNCSVDLNGKKCLNKLLNFIENDIVSQIRHYVAVQINIDQFHRRHKKDYKSNWDELKVNSTTTMEKKLIENDIISKSTISMIISVLIDAINHSESLNKAWKLIHTNDCTIPNFITILPIFYLRRFKKIWTLSKNDKLEDCKSIWKETREFINQLPKILQNKFINFVDKEENDKANGNFILELLPEERQFFEKTLRNVSMAMEKKIEILSVWGNERLSTSALGDFNKFLESIAKKDKRFSEKIDKLSPEAKKAYRQIIELQKHKQKLFESFSNDVKNELVNLWKHDTIRKSKNLLLEKEALTIDDGIC